mmetsp:Transcript_19904/g.19530  ORF Transcript_19904/g.19530 Transcript_19904/m.19530 type:complete len:112 (-) Transcript_19904:95-430(-)
MKIKRKIDQSNRENNHHKRDTSFPKLKIDAYKKFLAKTNQLPRSGKSLTRPRKSTNLVNIKINSGSNALFTRKMNPKKTMNILDFPTPSNKRPDKLFSLRSTKRPLHRENK